MNSKTARNSNIELLRLITMLFIVMHHYTNQVDWGGAWSADNYSLNVLILHLFYIGGPTGNNIFMLITGYYLIKSGVRLKKILLLMAEFFFYSWTIALILYGFRIIPFSIKSAIRAAVPNWFGCNWYVSCYIIFSFFVPFLNDYLHSISQKTYLRLLAFLLFLRFAYTFRGATYLAKDGLDQFFVMYLLGGYIRLYGLECKYIKSWWKTFAVLMVLLVLSTVTISVGGYLLKRDSFLKYENAAHFAQGASILDIAVTVALFQAVIHSKPFYNRYINMASASTVGIFLIHMNSQLAPVIWGKLWSNVNYLHSPWLPLHVVTKSIAVFIACLAIDMLRRRFLEPPFSRWLDKFLEVPIRERLKRLVPPPASDR